PKGDRGDRERAPGSSDPRWVVSRFRAHVLHGLGRIPRLQSGDLPRTVAERTLLPRGAPDVLVPGVRDAPRRGGHRVRRPRREPSLDEVPYRLRRMRPDDRVDT